MRVKDSFFSRETKLSFVYLFKWITIAVFAGMLGNAVTHSFVFLLRKAYNLLNLFHFPLFVYPLMGALVNGIFLYRFAPNAKGEGIPSYIRSVRNTDGTFSLKVTFVKYLAALSTLGTYGNGGVVGPLGRVTAGLASSIISKSKRIGFTYKDIRIAAICGMAAAVGTVFHSPIGGGIFAVEIIQKDKMKYKDLFPAILSSSSAVFFTRIIHFKPVYRFPAVNEYMDMRMIGWIVLLSVAGGIIGGFFAWFYKFTAKLLKRESGSILVKVLTGSFVAGIIAWTVNPHLAGTSSGLIIGILNRDISVLQGNIPVFLPVSLVLLLLILLKTAANTLTVGSGMSAGFTGPAAITGMLLGFAFSEFLGIDKSTATHFGFIAAGFSSVLAGSMNIPIASAVMGVEIFGLYYSLPVALGAVIGFQTTRNRTIYEYAMKDEF